MIGLNMLILEGDGIPTDQIDTIVPSKKISEHLKPMLASGLGVLVIGKLVKGEYRVQEMRFEDKFLPKDALELLCKSMGIPVLKDENA